MFPVLTYQLRTLRSSISKLRSTFSVLKAKLFEHIFEEEVLKGAEMLEE